MAVVYNAPAISHKAVLGQVESPAFRYTLFWIQRVCCLVLQIYSIFILACDQINRRSRL